MMRRPISRKPYNNRIFNKLIEQCGQDIFKFLTSSEQSRLKQVSRVTFYFIQSYQIWNMMIFDNEKLSQGSTKDDSSIEKSFLKQSFYSNSLSRPQTESTQRIKQQPQQWLVKPQEQKKKPLFLTKKNVIEENLLSDEELRVTIDMWTLSLKQLEKTIKIDKIETDSLIQEITLWNDNLKVLKELKLELQQDYVIKILKLLKQRAILDPTFERKQKLMDEIINKQFVDYEDRKKLVEILQDIKPQLQKLTQAKLGDFYDQSELLWNKLDFIINNKQLLRLFVQRSEYFFMKVFNLAKNLYKVDLSWVINFQNYDTCMQLLQQFSKFIQHLVILYKFNVVKQKRHDCTMQALPIAQQNEQLYINWKKGLDDLQKMLRLNKKLYDQQKDAPIIQQLMQMYKNQTFNNFGDRQQWNEFYKSWKQRYQSKQLDSQTEQEGMSFGFCQTRKQKISQPKKIYSYIYKSPKKDQKNANFKNNQMQTQGVKKRITKVNHVIPIYCQAQRLNITINFNFQVFVRPKKQQTWLDKIPIYLEEFKDPCAICLANQDSNQLKLQLKCSHIFHKTCIENWLQIKPECPQCRERF
ncbi:hypothetical protein pb186bvf_019546 [Paramecium bursaria]